MEKSFSSQNNQPKCPACGGTDLKVIQNANFGMFVFCQTVGCRTYPVDTSPVRLEGALHYGHTPAEVVEKQSLMPKEQWLRLPWLTGALTGASPVRVPMYELIREAVWFLQWLELTMRKSGMLPAVPSKRIPPSKV